MNYNALHTAFFDGHLISCQNHNSKCKIEAIKYNTVITIDLNSIEC